MVNRTIPPVLVRVVPAAHSGGGGEPGGGGGGGGGRILSPLRKRERERGFVVFLRLFPFLFFSFLFFFLTTFLLFKNSSFLLHSRKTNTNERTNERTKVLEGTLIKLSQIVRRRRAHATTAESVRGGVFLRVSRRVGRAQLLRAGFKHPEYEDDEDDDGFYHQRRRRRRRRKRKVKKTTRLSRRQKRKSGEV